MQQYLIRFRAEYYCQGYEWAWFERLIEANSYEDACKQLKTMNVRDWEINTPELFKNLTIQSQINPKSTYTEDWNPDWKGDPNDELRWKGW